MNKLKIRAAVLRKSAVKHCPPTDYSHKAFRRLGYDWLKKKKENPSFNSLLDIKRKGTIGPQSNSSRVRCTNLSVLAHIKASVEMGLSAKSHKHTQETSPREPSRFSVRCFWTTAERLPFISFQFSYQIRRDCGVNAEKKVVNRNVTNKQNGLIPHCWFELGCLQTPGCWQRSTGFLQPRGEGPSQRGICFCCHQKNPHRRPETRKRRMNICPFQLYLCRRAELHARLLDVTEKFWKQMHTQRFDQLGSWPWWFWQGWP